ncbi:MAG: hypothetical protein ACFCD0_02930 [Gemmataceae bacterium]
MQRSRREAIFILVLWGLCFLYTVPYCYFNGYLSHEPMPEKLSTGPAIGKLLGPLEGHDRKHELPDMPYDLGIPDWVFWGVALPWGLCLVVTFVFCLFFYSEEDLGQDPATTNGEA